MQMKLMILADEFLMFKRSYCAPASIRYYRDNLRMFSDWLCTREGVSADRLDVTLVSRQLYLDYLVYLRGLHIKNVSVNTYIRAVKVFCRWLYEEGYLDEDVTQRMKYPRPDPDFVYPLTVGEAARLDKCFDMGTYLGLRNYCIVHLMLDCGFRSGEVAALEWQHVRKGYVQVFNGKFNKTRHVPLPDWLYSAMCGLSDYPGMFRGRVFLNRYRDGPLTENAVKQLFSDLKKRSGIDRIHAHLLRHTFASSFIFYGGGMEMLRVLLGHGSYAVTQNYLHIASQMLIAGYDMYRIDDMFFNLALFNRR